MKKISFKLKLSAILLFFLFCFSGSISAQISDNPSFQQQSVESATEDGNPGDPYCDPLCTCMNDANHTPCPIDNGLLFLLAIGVVYGIKKVKDAKAVKKIA